LRIVMTDSEKDLAAVASKIRQGNAGVAHELAKQIMGELGHEDVAAYLEGRICEVADAQHKILLLEAYSRLEKQESITLLIRLAADASESDHVREFSLHRLAKIGTRVASDAVLAGISDPDPVLRRLAIEATVSLDKERVAEQLRSAIEDPDERVQAAAVSSLIALNAREAARNLRYYLERNPMSPEAERVRRFLAAEEMVTIFSNIPALPQKVAWRDSYIADIVRTVKSSSGRVAIIVGPGGSGKSTIAKLIARTIESEFKLWLGPDACRGEELAISLTSALRESLGDRQADPPYGVTGNDYTRNLQDIVQADGRRFLVVLDGLDEVHSDVDARSAVRLLADIVKANPNALALITSRPVSLRNRAVAAAVRYVQASPLATSEAAEFIRSIVPDSNVSSYSLWRLAELSQGSVLVLQLLADRLTAGQQFVINDAASLLADHLSNNLWSEVVARLMNGADPASQLALQVVAICGGRLALDHYAKQQFASEGIEDPLAVYTHLEARGLTVTDPNSIVRLFRKAFRASIVADLEPRDAARLTDKFKPSWHQGGDRDYVPNYPHHAEGTYGGDW
jgi:HEAT repeat protein